MRYLNNLAAALLACAAAIDTPAHAQVRADSRTGVQSIQTPSVCPNIDTEWYATVPAGMYKSSADGNCYGIPACVFGWNAVAQTCNAAPTVDVCPNLAGDQATVPAGYEPYGGQCVPMCTGGSVRNGAGVCACPVGTTLVAGSCVAPPTVTAAWSPASIKGGDQATLAWSVTGASTASIACAGSVFAQAATATTASGTATITAPSGVEAATTTCTVSATTDAGSASAQAALSVAPKDLACPAPEVPVAGACWMPDPVAYIATGALPEYRHAVPGVKAVVLAGIEPLQGLGWWDPAVSVNPDILNPYSCRSLSSNVPAYAGSWCYEWNGHDRRMYRVLTTMTMQGRVTSRTAVYQWANSSQPGAYVEVSNQYWQLN